MIAKLIIVTLALGSVALATAEPEKELIPVEKPANNAESFCQGCRSLLSFANFYNSTENRTQFKDLTMEFCQLQTAGAHEDDYCNWFTESIFGVLQRMDPVRHCDQVGACSHSGSDQCFTQSCQKSSNEIPTGLDDGIVCQICEQAIMQVKTALTDPDVVTQLKQQAEAFCTYLAIIGEDKMCRHMIDNYLDQAIDFLRNVKPSLYCKSISLCSSSVSAELKQMPIPPSVLASFKGFGIENKVFINNKLVKDISSVSNQRPVIKGPNCILCKTMVKEMFNFLKDNRTEDSVRHGLDNICSYIFSKNPNKLKNCEEMVATYSKQIIHMLIDETDPNLICTLLEQCTYRRIDLKTSKPIGQLEKPVDLGQFMSLLSPSIEAGSKRSCLECKIFIEYLQGAVSDVKTEEEVVDWLNENLCNTFHSRSIKNTCTNLINNYSSILFKAVIKELDPKTACIQLKACSPSRFQTYVVDNIPKPIVTQSLPAKPTRQPPQEKKASSIRRLGNFCDQCIDFVTQIDEYLSSHPLDHDVSVLIDQVCNKIPNEFAKAQCVIFVKTFGQDIAQAISTMQNPRQLCTKFMLCA